MRIDVKECARLLLEQDDILILTHAHPDGDTLGCGFALCRALLQKGKFAYVKNEADIPPKYNYLFDDIVEIKFKPDYIVAVDVATVNLLGGLEEQYKVDMCIDHHSTNTEYADLLLLEDVPAACQIMYDGNLCLVQTHNVFGDVQSDAQPRFVVASGVIRLIKAFKNFR